MLHVHFITKVHWILEGIEDVRYAVCRDVDLLRFSTVPESVKSARGGARVGPDLHFVADCLDEAEEAFAEGLRQLDRARMHLAYFDYGREGHDEDDSSSDNPPVRQRRRLSTSPCHVPPPVVAQEVMEVDDVPAQPRLVALDNPQLTIRRGPRARVVFNIGYFEPHILISELHWEYARISRRGAGTFCLVQAGLQLQGGRGLWSLSQLVVIEAPTWQPRHDGEDPPSMTERAGSPSAIKNRLVKKAEKSTIGLASWCIYFGRLTRTESSRCWDASASWLCFAGDCSGEGLSVQEWSLAGPET